MNQFLTHHITNAKTNSNEWVPIYYGILYKDDIKRQLHDYLYTQGSRALAVKIMMTSSKETFFALPALCESTGDQSTANGAEPWCFIWCAFVQTAEQTVEMPVILDNIALIVTWL